MKGYWKKSPLEKDDSNSEVTFQLLQDMLHVMKEAVTWNSRQTSLPSSSSSRLCSWCSSGWEQNKRWCEHVSISFAFENHSFSFEYNRFHFDLTPKGKIHVGIDMEGSKLFSMLHLFHRVCSCFIIACTLIVCLSVSESATNRGMWIAELLVRYAVQTPLLHYMQTV